MRAIRRGRLIALEGIDGCGKSTQAALLADHLKARLTFEPGATPLGTALRELLLNPALPDVEARAEALLMAADRAQHVAEVIDPLLAAGTSVVTDRFTASTLAYQGFGQRLDPQYAGGAERVGHGWNFARCQRPRRHCLELARTRMEPARADRFEGLENVFPMPCPRRLPAIGQVRPRRVGGRRWHRRCCRRRRTGAPDGGGTAGP